jgi:hypothetical protein
MRRQTGFRGHAHHNLRVLSGVLAILGFPSDYSVLELPG